SRARWANPRLRRGDDGTIHRIFMARCCGLCLAHHPAGRASSRTVRQPSRGRPSVMTDMFSELFNPYNLQVGLMIVVNCFLALSVWIPLSAGQLSLGGAGFMSVGAYTAAILSLHLGW